MKSECPYRTLPRYGWWDDTNADQVEDVSLIVSPKFVIDRNSKIATSGSCFAQHLGRYLKLGSHCHFVTEMPLELMTDDEARYYHYGVFSTRSGNIYTSRALRQLLERALGTWDSEEPAWRKGERFIDPLRPYIQPGGYVSLAEMECDRSNHLAAVRKMIAELDVFVFTLGLTEMWERKSDLTALPSCPGCSFGEFNDEIYQFVNLTITDVIADLERVVEIIKSQNSHAKILFTVSPVPLIASYSGKHVLEANTYSKSVLRVAAETLRNSHCDVDYLPSYEIITGSFSRGMYFASNMRTVTEHGVQHVMRNFFRAYSADAELFKGGHANFQGSNLNNCPDVSGRDSNLSQNTVDLICDEENLRQQYLLSQ
jgi:hypothetical protein